MKKPILIAAALASLASAASASPILGPVSAPAPSVGRPSASMVQPVRQNLVHTYRAIRSFLLTRSVIR
jgi:hypothetical protein